MNMLKAGERHEHQDYLDDILTLLDRLERAYARKDELIEALQIIRDDLNDALEVYPIVNQKDVEKVRNFANDASE